MKFCRLVVYKENEINGFFAVNFVSRNWCFHLEAYVLAFLIILFIGDEGHVSLI